MKYGTGLPLGAALEASAARDMAQALDGAGFDFVTLAGHMLSAEAGRFPDRPVMTYNGSFHDPFVLFSYLAASTERIAFRTGIMILPLYQTGAVARAGADLARLSGNRFELGVGISWNDAEYQAAGVDFRTRGRRQGEQLELLRRLWSEPYVTFSGEFHTYDQVGLGDHLPERPIPIWVGSTMDERPMRRAAHLADGWMPMGEPEPEVLDRLRGFLDEADRDFAGFGLTQRVNAGPEGPDAWVEEARRLQGIGATHLTIGAPPDLAPADALARTIEAKQAIADALG